MLIQTWQDKEEVQRRSAAWSQYPPCLERLPVRLQRQRPIRVVPPRAAVLAKRCFLARRRRAVPPAPPRAHLREGPHTVGRASLTQWHGAGLIQAHPACVGCAWLQLFEATAFNFNLHRPEHPTRRPLLSSTASPRPDSCGHGAIRTPVNPLEVSRPALNTSKVELPRECRARPCCAPLSDCGAIW